MAHVRPHLLHWQWQGYASTHRDRANLVLHLATVPLFWTGAALGVGALVLGEMAPAAGLSVLWLIALAAQANGHRREATPTQPFLGVTDFVVRLFAEQFITFPRYVLSGAFVRALRSR